MLDLAARVKSISHCKVNNIKKSCDQFYFKTQGGTSFGNSYNEYFGLYTVVTNYHQPNKLFLFMIDVKTNMVTAMGTELTNKSNELNATIKKLQTQQNKNKELNKVISELTKVTKDIG